MRYRNIFIGGVLGVTLSMFTIVKVDNILSAKVICTWFKYHVQFVNFWKKRYKRYQIVV